MPSHFTEDSLKLMQTYGLGMFLALALLVILIWQLKCSRKDAQDDREAASAREARCDAREADLMKMITETLGHLTSQLQTVTQVLASTQTQATQNAQAGEARYAIFMKAQEMQRIEHANMLAQIQGLKENANDFECHALTVIQQPPKTGG